MKKYFTTKQFLVSKYVDLGRKLLLNVLSPINQFARHLVEVQEKDPDYAAPPPKEASFIRPSFRFDETRKWTKKHFKNPALNHPILVGRANLESEGGLKDKAMEELTMKAAAERATVKEEILQRTIPQSNADELFLRISSELNLSDKKEVDDVEVEITSGSRTVSKKKVAAKKVPPKKKPVRIKKTKRGNVHRVED